MLPCAVAFCSFIVVVMPAVELDNEMDGGAEKIHDVGTDRCLATEMCAGHGQFFQRAPQRALVRRGV